MPNSLYGHGRRRFLEGDLDWLVHDFRVVLVDLAEYTVDLEGHEFLADIPSQARIAVSDLLTGKTSTVPVGGVADAQDVTFTGVPNVSIEAVVLYRDTGDPSTSPLVAYWDSSNAFPVQVNNGDITLRFSNEDFRVLKL